MLRLRHFAFGLVFAGGVCLALTGCWDTSTGSTTHACPNSDPLASQKAAIADNRQQALKTYHETCYNVFVEHPGNGFSRRPISPSITYPKSLQLPARADVVNATPAGQPLPEGTAPWTAEKIELVSLLMHDKPGVYPAEGRIMSSRPKIRDLDDFEVQSLPALRGGEQVVILDVPGEVRMLGAIRAKGECLFCHRAQEGREPIKEGDLLGAFTYRIKPLGKEAAPTKGDSSPATQTEQTPIP